MPICRSAATDDSNSGAIAVTGLIEYALANPALLIPVLLLAAVVVFAILKKLLKLAAILVIAGVLYALLVEYFGSGL